jgi:DNA (cytosine-5)-methyltransferase 1
MGRQDYETETVIAHALLANGFDASEDGTGRGTPLVPVVAKTLTRGAESSGKGGYAGRRQEDDDNLVLTLAIRGRGDGHELEYRDDGTANAILTPNGGRAGIGVGAIARGWAVRRLTPRECERLQGFPDDYTLIPYRGKLAADGPRYKALGNSMAVNVMRWLGRRIELVNALVQEAA